MECRDFVKMPMPWKDLLCYRRSRALGGWKMTHPLFYSNPEKEIEIVKLLAQLKSTEYHEYLVASRFVVLRNENRVLP